MTPHAGAILLPAEDPSPAAACRELAGMFPAGPVNIVWIDPGTGAVSGLTRPAADDAIRAAIAERIDTHNLYFTVNSPRPAAPHGKLKKADIEHLRGVFADIDLRPDETREGGRARIQAVIADLPAEPSTFIDSGNGFQLIWWFPDPLLASAFAARAEAVGRSIARTIGGDAVQNIDRVLRIPYTNNLPTAKKRAIGRTAAPTSIVRRSDKRYSIKELERHFPPVQDTVRPAVSAHAVDWLAALDDLPAELEERRDAAARADAVLRSFLDGSHPHTGDGSRVDYGLAGRLHDHGFEPQEIAAVMCHCEHSNMHAAATGHYKDGVERYFDRALSRSRSPRAAEEFDVIVGFDPGHPPALNDNAEGVPAPADRRKLRSVNVWDVGPQNAPQYVIKGVAHRRALSIWFGAPGSYKSFVLLDLAAHVALGKPWHGRRTRAGLVLYVMAEGAGGLGQRVEAMRRRTHPELVHSASGERPPLDFIAESIDLLAVRGPHGQSDTERLIALVREKERNFGQPCVLLVVDTLARVMIGGDENSSAEMGRLVDNAGQVIAEIGCHFAFVHHTGKDEARGMRGSSALRAAADTAFKVANVSEPGRSRRGQIASDKQKDGPDDASFAFEMASVVVGVDEDDGDPVTSLVVLPAQAGAGFSPDIEAAAARERRARSATTEADAVVSCILSEMGTARSIPLKSVLPAVQEAFRVHRGAESFDDTTARKHLKKILAKPYAFTNENGSEVVGLSRVDPDNSRSALELVRGGYPFVD